MLFSFISLLITFIVSNSLPLHNHQTKILEKVFHLQRNHFNFEYELDKKSDFISREHVKSHLRIGCSHSYSMGSRFGNDYHNFTKFSNKKCF